MIKRIPGATDSGEQEQPDLSKQYLEGQSKLLTGIKSIFTYSKLSSPTILVHSEFIITIKILTNHSASKFSHSKSLFLSRVTAKFAHCLNEV